MKINIIGSGWLAQPLAKQLLHNGDEVILTTTQLNKVADLKHQELHAKQYVLGDQLSNPNELFDADVLIIAITSKDLESFEILMDQLSEYPALNILYISSTSVYQTNNLNNFPRQDESSTALNHENSIWQIEQLIKTHPFASIIRFAGLVGPGRHPGRFFSGDKVIKVPAAPVNLIHLDDCIGIIETVIRQAAWNEIYNGCADNHPSKGEFYQQMAQQLGKAFPSLGTAKTGSHKIIDNNKVKQHLNYQFKYPDVMSMNFE